MKAPVVGQWVKIDYGNWSGLFKIVRLMEHKSLLVIDHPRHGEGAFHWDNTKEVTIIPLTKLEKALK